MERDQMRFIFHHHPPCSTHTSSIDNAVLGPHWLKKSSTADMMRVYELLSPTLYVKSWNKDMTNIKNPFYLFHFSK